MIFRPTQRRSVLKFNRVLCMLVLLMATSWVLSASGNPERADKVSDENYILEIAGDASVRGRVVDGFGKPTAARLLLCGDVCWPATADAEGSFHITDVPAALYTLRTYDDAEEPLCSAPPIELELIADHTTALTAPVILSECG